MGQGRQPANTPPPQSGWVLVSQGGAAAAGTLGALALLAGLIVWIVNLPVGDMDLEGIGLLLIEILLLGGGALAVIIAISMWHFAGRLHDPGSAGLPAVVLVAAWVAFALLLGLWAAAWATFLGTRT